MELNVRVLCRAELAPGFELAGLTVTRAQDASQAVEALRHLTASNRVGMVLVDDALYDALPAELRARFDREALPVVAPFPAPAWDAASEAEAYVLEILRQAIGYRVRPT